MRNLLKLRGRNNSNTTNQNRDIGVSVAHGLPCTLSLLDFDIPPLSPDDFNEEPVGSDHTPRYPHSETEIRFFMQQTKVMEALHHIHCGHFIRQRLQPHMTGSISQRENSYRQNTVPPGAKADRSWYVDDYQDQGLILCKDWLDRLPEAVQYDVNNIQGHTFWPAFLHILY